MDCSQVSYHSKLLYLILPVILR